MLWLKLLLLVLNVNGREGNSVNYYKKVWNDGIASAKSYIPPKSNSEFARYENNNCADFGLFDFVIVGGGSGGSTIASRLSEISDWKILLLEAGGNETDLSMMPGADILNYLSDLNYGYLTVPQKNACFGNVNHQCNFPRGKVLGGSSSINAMVYMRGNKGDYDAWENMGNPGWSYKDVLPYFKKSESINFPGDASYRGVNGPLSVTQPKPNPPYLQSVLDANQEIGFKIIDYNGQSQYGISIAQGTIKNGRRFSANQAYLQPALNRTNLIVKTNSFVIKILFTNKRAERIKFLHAGKCFIANASKEVILSAGAVNTPQLLMLSGIGPEIQLNKFNITPIAFLPVGQSMENHPTLTQVNLRANVTNASLTFDEAIEEYVKGEGPLTYPRSLQLAFVKARSRDYPDVEVQYSQPIPYIPFDVRKKSLYYNDELDDMLRYGTPNDIVVTFVLQRPRSKGSITLKSNDPLDFPLIDPNYLGDPTDLKVLYVAVYNTFTRLLRTEAFQKINVTLPEIPIKACNGLKDKEYWYCIIKYKSQGMIHPASSCRMGNNTSISVVDKNLLVHGINSLRIVDASVMPTIPSSHLNAVVIMIAEKISDTIKNLYIT